MKNASLLLALLIGCAARAPAQESVEAEVRQMLEEYVAATNRSDWEEVSTYYADDPAFRWLEDGVVRYGSHEELLQTFDNLDQMFSEVAMELIDTVIVPLGEDAAQVSSLFRQNVILADGTPFTIEGGISMTVVRRAGRWLFLLGHTSSPRNRPDL